MTLILKRILLFLIVFKTSNFNAQSKSDNEWEKMDKLENSITKYENENISANEKIYSFYSETSNEIRKYQSQLTVENYELILNFQKILWSQIVERRKLYPNSRKFLASESSSLYSFKSKVLERLGSYLNNPEQNISRNGNLEIEKSKYKSELLKCIENNLTKDQQIQYLKNTNKEMNDLITKGTENIEKALISIKQKDLKIAELQNAIIKKDSINLEYIKSLKK